MSFDILIVSILSSIGSIAVLYFLFAKKLNEKHPQTPATATPSAVLASNEQTKQIILDAKEEALKIKTAAERESAEIRNKSLELEKKAEKRFDELYAKIKEIERKEENLTKTEVSLKEKESSIDRIKQEQTDKLSFISTLTKDEAKKLILQNLESSLQADMARKIREYEEKLSA